MILALLLAVSPFVAVDVGSASGYHFPFLSVGGGLQTQGKSVLFEAEGFYSSTNKLVYGDVSQYYGSSRILVSTGRLALGGGATFAHIIFHDLDDRRSAIRPFATVGIRSKDALTTLDVVFPGYDPAYRIYKGVLRSEITLSRHFTLVPEVAMVKMRNTTDSFRSLGLSADFYLRVAP